MANEIVVKVGGSLLDLPDFGALLSQCLASQSSRRILLIPGGGSAVDLVRKAQSLESLSDETCHWLALAAMRFTADLLRSRVQNALVIGDVGNCESAWRQGRIPILDVLAFAIADESRPDPLPHSWAATSDSFAARAAIVAGIPELVLLKSCDAPAGADWGEAARRGFVDSLFPAIVAKAAPQLRVSAINLRQWPSADASAAPL